MEEQEITSENTWVDIKQKLTKAANNCIPKKKRNKRNNWMTDEIIELMNQRRSENDQRAVKELTMTIPRKCREAEDEEIEQKCREVEDLENRNETMKMYQLVRQFAPKEKPKQNKAIADKNGSLLCEKDKINKRWQEYMEELYDSKLERPELKTTENDEISLVEIFNAARESATTNPREVTALL